MDAVQYFFVEHKIDLQIMKFQLYTWNTQIMKNKNDSAFHSVTRPNETLRWCMPITSSKSPLYENKMLDLCKQHNSPSVF